MSFISRFRWPMRKALFSPLLALIACLMAAATPALAQVAISSPTVVSSPIPGNGTDGFEQCAAGTYATNRSESTIAVNPTDPSHLLGLSKSFFSSPSNSAETDWSTVYRFHLSSYDVSGGSALNQLLPGYTCTPGSGSTQWDVSTDPNVAFDANGNAYSAVLALNFNNLRNEIAVNKRPAGTTTWEPPVVVDQFTSAKGLGQEYDKQWIAADWTGKTNNVYVAFTIFSLASGRIYFARSTDGGQTFSQPRVVSSLGGFNTYVYLDVDPSGNLYLEYTNFAHLFSNSGRAVVRESTDGGLSFGPSRVGPSFTGEPFVPRTNDGWTLPNTTFRDGIIDYFAVSHAHPGHLYLGTEQWDKAGCTSSSDPGGDYDVGFYSSLDGGQTWSPASCANDPSTQGDTTDQFQPEVAADAQGHVAVAWYDRRAACPTSQPAGAPGYYTSPGASNYCIQTGLQWYSDSGSAVSAKGSNQLFGPIWDPQEPANEAAPVSTTNAWPAGYVSDLPHSVFNPCYNALFGTFIPVCVTFIGDYFGLAVSSGTADILNVSTYPSFNTIQPVSQWAQPPTTAGAFTAAATYPAANNYYQQQVLTTASAP
jgi:hypothetical protein